MTSSYNLASLETDLLGTGWTVVAADFVLPQDIPGQVHKGGYQITLTSPTGAQFRGDGPTRSDALRAAAGQAGVLREDGINLI